ncbi:insulin-degrading enzyme-like protein, partial [Trifolium pratense]
MVLSSDVIKSEYDFRDYKIIRLRNGLQALIVHDPAISSKHKSEDEDDGKIKLLTAAVALTVGVGNLDSLELYGLPHLIEHVYSPKSEKFSEDDGSENFSEDDGIEKLSEDDESENVSKNDGFRDFIYEHGGYANACTYAEFTSYQFNIREKYLKAALERFANCLIEPVIEELALKKEVGIIDSEFYEEKDNHQRILECLRSHTLIESHPYHNVFHGGNKQSLMGDKDDYGDLRDKVVKFHRENYQGKKMKLVVIGGDLDPPDNTSWHPPFEDPMMISTFSPT